MTTTSKVPEARLARSCPRGIKKESRAEAVGEAACVPLPLLGRPPFFLFRFLLPHDLFERLPYRRRAFPFRFRFAVVPFRPLLPCGWRRPNACADFPPVVGVVVFYVVVFVSFVSFSSSSFLWLASLPFPTPLFLFVPSLHAHRRRWRTVASIHQDGRFVVGWALLHHLLLLHLHSDGPSRVVHQWKRAAQSHRRNASGEVEMGETKKGKAGKRGWWR